MGTRSEWNGCSAPARVSRRHDFRSKGMTPFSSGQCAAPRRSGRRRRRSRIPCRARGSQSTRRIPPACRRLADCIRCSSIAAVGAPAPGVWMSHPQDGVPSTSGFHPFSWSMILGHRTHDCTRAPHPGRRLQILAQVGTQARCLHIDLAGDDGGDLRHARPLPHGSAIWAASPRACSTTRWQPVWLTRRWRPSSPSCRPFCSFWSQGTADAPFAGVIGVCALVGLAYSFFI